MLGWVTAHSSTVGISKSHPDTPCACLSPLDSRSSSCTLTCLPSTQQLVSEKVGGAEGTKLDDDFKEMEKVGGPRHSQH